MCSSDYKLTVDVQMTWPIKLHVEQMQFKVSAGPMDSYWIENHRLNIIYNPIEHYQINEILESTTKVIPWIFKSRKLQYKNRIIKHILKNLKIIWRVANSKFIWIFWRINKVTFMLIATLTNAFQMIRRHGLNSFTNWIMTNMICRLICRKLYGFSYFTTLST